MEQCSDLFQDQLFQRVRRNPLDRASAEIALGIFETDIIAVTLVLPFYCMGKRKSSATASAINHTGKGIDFRSAASAVVIHIAFEHDLHLDLVFKVCICIIISCALLALLPLFIVSILIIAGTVSLSL